MVALQIQHQLGLALGLDALGHGRHAQRARNADGGLDQHPVVLHRLRMSDEAAVDLDRVHRQLVQTGQRGVTGAEVVQRQLHAQVLEVAQGQLHGFVLRRQALGHLQLQALGSHAAVLQQIGQLVHHAGAPELGPRQVHRQLRRRPRSERAAPMHELGAGLAQHHGTDGVDEAGILGHADEVRR